VSSKQSNFFFGSNRNKPKLNLFRLFFGLFHETKKHFFRFVSVFWTSIETTKTNRTLSKQTETNPKISKIRSLLGGPRNTKKFFSQFEPQTNQHSICFNCFWFVSSQNRTIFFLGLFRCFGPVLKQPKQTELMVWGIKKVDILTITVGLLFVSVVSKHRNSLFRY
jgi:hypothetical protein